MIVIRPILLILLFFSLPASSPAENFSTDLLKKSTGTSNIIFVNGILNNLEQYLNSVDEIDKILKNTNIELNGIKGSDYNFKIWGTWNPIGHESDINNNNLQNAYQDIKELMKLKVDEERYASDLLNITSPHYYKDHSSFDPSYSDNILQYIDGLSSEDLRATHGAIYRLIALMERLETSIVVAHSEGNIIANLAYAYMVNRYGNDIDSKLRIINVANTSILAVSSLDFTHSSDRALTALEVSGNLTLPRNTPFCFGACNFKTNTATFKEIDDSITTLNHELIEVYLSDKVSPEPNDVDLQQVQFTDGATSFKDRFVDFVFTAYNSIIKDSGPEGTINIISSFNVPSHLNGYAFVKLQVNDYETTDGFRFEIYRPGSINAPLPDISDNIIVYDGTTNEGKGDPASMFSANEISVTRNLVDNRDQTINIHFQISNTSLEPYLYNDKYRICKAEICSDYIEFNFEIGSCIRDNDCF